MSKEHQIQEAVQRIQKAIQTNQTCAPIRDIIGIDPIGLAYQIQEEITRQRVEKGGRIVGRKIGLTSFAVQKQLGVDQPDYGTLFHDMEVLTGATIPWDQLMQPKAEAEIAFVLKEDINTDQLGIVDIIHAIDYALVSIEVVGSRIHNWDVKITDTIADNASASHFVLGHRPMKLFKLDLIECEMRMYKNNELVSQGRGKDCMGSPLNATLWLARQMAQLNQPLSKGDIILSGALGPMCNVEQGDTIRTEIGGLGMTEVTFGAS